MNSENTPAVSLGKPGGPPAVRASDADRDRIADILREALAEGRLDAEEHAERVEAVYRAKTVGELEPLIEDLPAGQRNAAAAPPSRSPAVAPRPDQAQAPARGHGPHHSGGKNVVAVCSGAVRSGRWRVGGKVNAVAVCGGVEIDLTEAIFEEQHVVINATAVCGGVEIRVPENVSLRGSGSGVMGGFEVREGESDQPDAPVVTVQGAAIWGGVEAKRVKGKRVEDLREH